MEKLEQSKVINMINHFWSPITDKKGVTIYILDIELYIHWLSQQGYNKVDIGDSYIFVKVTGNIVEKVSRDKIAFFVFYYLMNLQGVDIGAVKKMYSVNEKSICSIDRLNLLPSLEVNMQRDTSTEVLKFYKNGFITITKDNIVLNKLSDYKGYIWKDNIIDRNFKIIDESQYKESIFRQFLCNVVSHKLEREQNMFKSLGYLQSNFKDRSFSKIVVYSDDNPDSTNDSNGRTGKGLIVQGLGHTTNKITVGSDTAKNDSKYMFSTVNESTEIVAFEDLDKLKNLRSFYNATTDDLTIRKMGKEPQIIPFANSPKLLLTYNYFAGDGNSSDMGRIIDIPLDAHYSLYYTPIDDFKIRLFDDFNIEQWQQFDNFMMSCIKLYLSNGLEQVNTKHRQYKELEVKVGKTFLELMENIEDGKLPNYILGQKWENSSIASLLKTRGFTSISTKASKQKINNWCKYKGYELKDNLRDGSYRSFMILTEQQSKIELNKETYGFNEPT